MTFLNWIRTNWLNILIGGTLGAVIAIVQTSHWNYAVTTQKPQTATEIVSMVNCPPIEEKALPEASDSIQVKELVEDDGFIYVEIVDLTEAEQRTVWESCQKYGVTFSLVLAMIEKESTCNPSAINADETCFGAMQIHKVNFEWIQEEIGNEMDFLDLADNTEAGSLILSKLFLKYDDMHKVLMSYNMGEGGASKCWNEGIMSSSYSREICDREEIIRTYIEERMEKA